MELLASRGNLSCFPGHRGHTEERGKEVQSEFFHDKDNNNPLIIGFFFKSGVMVEDHTFALFNFGTLPLSFCFVLLYLVGPCCAGGPVRQTGGSAGQGGEDLQALCRAGSAGLWLADITHHPLPLLRLREPRLGRSAGCRVRLWPGRWWILPPPSLPRPC